MKLGRPLIDGFDGLVCRISRSLLALGQAYSWPSEAEADGVGEQQSPPNLAESEHFHWFFSGADLLCMPKTDRAGEARCIAIQANDAA
jgi:hypothetical protein